MQKVTRMIMLLVIGWMAVATMQARRPKIGLVLGGGGAKGAAEVGVLKVLERAGIRPDYVVGTSIGSVVGGLYASGVSVEQMEQLFLRQDWLSLFADRKMELSTTLYTQRDGMYYVLGFPIYDARRGKQSSNGLLKGDSITSLLGRLTGQTKHIHFDKLKIPFRCVSFDVETMQEVVLEEGILPQCLRASISIPLAFTSVDKGGKQLIDGGAMNNLPVDVVKRMGAEIVIAIDLDQSAYTKQPAKVVEKEPTFWEKAFNYGMKVAKHVDLGKYVNWLTRRPDEAKYHENLKHADFCINPDLHEYNLASFSRPSIQAMIKRGEQAAARTVPLIVKRLVDEIFER